MEDKKNVVSVSGVISKDMEMFLFYVSKNKAVLLPKSFMVNHEMIKHRKIIHNNALTQKVKLLEEAVYL